MSEVKPKRKTISKKTRFEVFKRDSFTCQYCGQKAPEVVLHIDHIIPVSKGGTNRITNLVSACQSCNSGKSDKLLGENCSANKAQKQAEMLQARREQIELISKWHMELEEQKDFEVESFNELYIKARNGEYELSDVGKNKVKNHIKKYGFQIVLECFIEANGIYNDANKALEKLPVFCAGKLDPTRKDRAYCIGILKNKLTYKYNKLYVLGQALDRVHKKTNFSYLELQDICKAITPASLTGVLEQLENYSESCEA